jgi:hypothetical protein
VSRRLFALIAAVLFGRFASGSPACGEKLGALVKAVVPKAGMAGEDAAVGEGAAQAAAGSHDVAVKPFFLLSLQA